MKIGKVKRIHKNAPAPIPVVLPQPKPIPVEIPKRKEEIKK